MRRQYRERRRPSCLHEADNHRSKIITVREESLYKPLLVTFLIFLFALVIVFPISIFDTTFPTVMAFFRRIVVLFSLSAIATLLVLPVSVFDIELLRIFSASDLYSNLYVIGIIIFAVFADTFFSFIGYRFTKTLRHLFMRKVKQKDIIKSNDKLNRYGNFAMFAFAFSPLPFTLAIYTAGALKLNRKGFLLAVALGRTVKYSAFALLLRLFGINLVEWGQNMLTTLFG